MLLFVNSGSKYEILYAYFSIVYEIRMAQESMYQKLNFIVDKEQRPSVGLL